MKTKLMIPFAFSVLTLSAVTAYFSTPVIDDTTSDDLFLDCVLAYTESNVSDGYESHPYACEEELSNGDLVSDTGTDCTSGGAEECVEIGCFDDKK